MFNSLQTYGLYPTRLLCLRNSPGVNTGVGCHSLPQGIFLIQESNLHLLHLLHCRWLLYHCTPSETLRRLPNLTFENPYTKAKIGWGGIS